MSEEEHDHEVRHKEGEMIFRISNGESTSSAKFQISDVFMHVPFVKKQQESVEQNQMILASKNKVGEVESRLFQDIRNREIILSHSSDPNIQQHCKGVIKRIWYLDRRIQITVGSILPCSLSPIWEDTDVWIFPVESKQNMSLVTQLVQANLKPIDQSEIFKRINGWRLVGERRKRLRRKFDNEWKNVYSTELQLTPVDAANFELLELVKVNTSLILSDEIDTPREVFVDVLKRTKEEGTVNSIIIGVTGFSNEHVNIPLSNSITYYLSVDESDVEDCASLNSEVGVLRGYPLEKNVDEICEKIGELTLSDTCIKTWFNMRHNFAYIRLVLTSTSRKLQSLKAFIGFHVIIRSHQKNRRLLAVINKVMKSDIVLTLKGAPRDGKSFVFSKSECFTLEFEHSYEDRLQLLKGSEGKLEMLRRQIYSAESDIRFFRSWREFSNGHPKCFASFIVKNEMYNHIPLGTKVLLAKCWEVEGQLNNKADFVFAVRIDEPKSQYQSTVSFEIKFTQKLVQNSNDFDLSKAFYYVDFDSSESVLRDPCYTLYNARSIYGPHENTVLKSFPISEDLNFVVFPYHNSTNINNNHRRKDLNWPQMRPIQPVRVVKSAVPTDASSASSLDGKVNKSPPQKIRSAVTTNRSKKPGRTINRNDGRQPRFLCCAYIELVAEDKRGNIHVNLRSGYDSDGSKKDVSPWDIGKRLLLTAKENMENFIRGSVQDTKGEKVVIMIDKNQSDLEFLRTWNKKNLLDCFAER